MFPVFLITFREVVEASIIVSVILSILKKSTRTKLSRVIWTAVVLAIVVCLLLLSIAITFGQKFQNYYSQYEAHLEGFLMIFSTFFIIWTVFYLHDYFNRQQRQLTGNLVAKVDTLASRNLFILIFTSVFREGFEIIIFISTIIISQNKTDIIFGYLIGIFAGVLVTTLIFKQTQKLDLSFIIKFTNMFLILYSANLLTRGLDEFSEVGILPQLDFYQIPIFIIYVLFFTYQIFFRRKIKKLL